MTAAIPTVTPIQPSEAPPHFTAGTALMMIAETFNTLAQGEWANVQHLLPSRELLGAGLDYGMKDRSENIGEFSLASGQKFTVIIQAVDPSPRLRRLRKAHPIGLTTEQIARLQAMEEDPACNTFHRRNATLLLRMQFMQLSDAEHGALSQMSPSAIGTLRRRFAERGFDAFFAGAI